mmetsp:Transcript_53889/g.114495  ORF Transcript_53889/g.114495 Transcript_53889/m.114495 type:complete len:139 (-) Transcript_53889:2652-3068(-)
MTFSAALSVSKLAKYLVIPTAIPAVHMLMVSSGLLGVNDDMLSMSSFWNDMFGVAIPPGFFFGFIGVGKLVGVAAMWDYLPMWLRLGVVTPAFCGGYTHYHDVPAGSVGTTVPACLIGSLCLFTMIVDKNYHNDKKTK